MQLTVPESPIIGQGMSNQYDEQISAGYVFDDIRQEKALKNLPFELKRVRLRVPNTGNVASDLAVPHGKWRHSSQSYVRDRKDDGKPQVQQRTPHPVLTFNRESH